MNPAPGRPEAIQPRTFEQDDRSGDLESSVTVLHRDRCDSAAQSQSPKVPRFLVVLEISSCAFDHARSIILVEPESRCIPHLPIGSFFVERLQAPPRAGPVSPHGWIPFVNFLD